MQVWKYHTELRKQKTAQTSAQSTGKHSFLEFASTDLTKDILAFWGLPLQYMKNYLCVYNTVSIYVYRAETEHWSN